MDPNPISEYLKKHDIQKMMENAVNQCFKEKSDNPQEFFARHFAKETQQKAITKVRGRQVLDSRGNPTVEVDIYCGDRVTGRASAPSGASTGSNEAREIRDGDKSKYMGKGTTKVVGHVNIEINDVLKGKDIMDLAGCDQAMQDKDGTDLKENLGGNAITATSFAIATAGANLGQMELFEYLAKAFHNKDIRDKKFSLPRPMVNILNGGKHAGGKLQIQEFMIVPRGDIKFSEALRQVSEIYHHLGKILVTKYGPSSKNVGDEGGFAPNLDTPDQALDAIEEAITAASYEVGKDIFLALDCAASEFYDNEKKQYEVIQGKFFSSEEMVSFYEKMIEDHPGLISIEDGLDEKDYDGWKKLTAALGSKVQLVGDDLYTTNPRFIKRGLEEKWANSLLLKVNQIGTISESMEAARLLFAENQSVIVSHRSGETSTTLISDLAVAIGAQFIKTGATARGERIAKYNRLLQIEEYLQEKSLLVVAAPEEANKEE